MSGELGTSAFRPRFIRDLPADSDAFDAHGRVATGLIEVALNHPDIKMVGLLGDWGSGKSTVVRLLQKGLEHDASNALFYVYDTWLRQSDPPRRAFLEGLIAFLERHQAVPASAKPRWDAKLAAFEGTQTTKVTATEIELTFAGKHMLPLLVVMPLGWKLIGDGVVKDGFHHDLATWIAFIAGWAITVAPVFMALYLRFVRKRGWSELLAVFTNKAPQSTIETHRRDPDPTAIEFQAMFADIMNTVHDVGRRMVIVVDNLDRLPPDEAVRLWATLRSFFLEESAGDRGISRTKLPLVLVPLDPGAPGRMHAGETGGSDALSQSFVEKTFDLVFRVPPPVLSSWQNHLGRQLQHLFGADLSARDLHAVTTIYEAFHRRPADGVSTTPRSLNSCVNAMGILWLQWRGHEGMVLPTIAYFVCLRTRIENQDHEGLRGVLKEEVAGVSTYDIDWRRSCAALHFGVPRARAGELYMGEPIRDAIATETPVALLRLSEEPGFPAYLSEVLDAPNPPSVASTARTLDAMGAISAAWSGDAWRRVRELALRHFYQQPLRAADDAALSAIVQNLPEPDRLAWLELFSRTVGSAPGEQLLVDDARHAAALFAKIAQLARAAGASAFQIPLTADLRVYIAVLGHGGDSQDLRALTPPAPANTIVQNLAAQLQQPETVLRALRAAGHYATIALADTDWTPVLDRAIEILGAGDPGSRTQAFAFVAQAYAAIPALQQRIPNARSQLEQAWANLPSELDDEALAAAIAVMLVADVNFQPSDGRDWDDFLTIRPALGPLVSQVVRVMTPSNDLPWLLQRMEAYPQLEPLMRSVAGARLGTDQGVPPVPGAYLLGNLGGYYRLLRRAPAAEFWKAAQQLDAFWSTLAAIDWDAASPIYTALASIDGSKAPLGRAVKDRLATVQAEDWDNAIMNGGHPWPLLLGLQVLQNRTQSLPDDAAARLAMRLPEAIASPDAAFRDRWFYLMGWVAPRSRAELRRNAATTLLSAGSANTLAILAAGGREFLGPEGLGAFPQRAALELLPRLLGDAAGIAWIEANRETVLGWVKAVPSSSRGELNASILHAVEANLSTNAPILTDLLEALGA